MLGREVVRHAHVVADLVRHHLSRRRLRLAPLVERNLRKTTDQNAHGLFKLNGTIELLNLCKKKTK